MKVHWDSASICEVSVVDNGHRIHGRPEPVEDAAVLIGGGGGGCVAVEGSPDELVAFAELVLEEVRAYRDRRRGVSDQPLPPTPVRETQTREENTRGEDTADDMG